MNIKSEKKSKKNIIVLVVAIIVIVCAGVYAFRDSIFKKNPGDNPAIQSTKIDYDEPTDEQKQAGEKAKEDFIKNTEEGGDNQNSQSLQSGDKIANLTITNTTFIDGKMTVRAIISGVSTIGECKATVTVGGKVIAEQTARTQLVHNYYGCLGFDFTGISGNGTVKISYSDPNGYTATEEKEF